MIPRPEWRTIDFRPALVGSRTFWLDSPAGFWSEPLVGWLIQEEISYGAASPETDWEETLPAADRDRRVVAATRDEAELVAVDEADNFWLILFPGEEEPTPAAETAERLRRQQRQEVVSGLRNAASRIFGVSGSEP